MYLHLCNCFTSVTDFLKRFYFIFRERGGKRNIHVREEHQLPLSTKRPSLRQTCSPVMCPDGESNLPPFPLWDDAQPTEPHLSGVTDSYALHSTTTVAFLKSLAPFPVLLILRLICVSWFKHILFFAYSLAPYTPSGKLPGGKMAVKLFAYLNLIQ